MSFYCQVFIFSKIVVSISRSEEANTHPALTQATHALSKNNTTANKPELFLLNS